MNTLSPSLTAADQGSLLHRIANRIRQSLDLQEILDTTVVEVRAFLGVDRVKVYKFHADESGLVIAESIDDERLPSLLGLTFPADDIPPYARELFLRVRQRSIVDVDNAQIGLSALEDPISGECEEDNDIRYRPLDPCHKEYLTAMGVRSSIVVPIVLTEPSSKAENSEPSAQLWGLISCHHSKPREVSETDLQFVQAIVDQVSIAVSQSVLLTQVQAQAEQEANINKITRLLHVSPTARLQAALEKTIETLDGIGGRLYLRAVNGLPREIYTYGEQPNDINPTQQRTVEENYLWEKFTQVIIDSEPDKTGFRPWSVGWMRSVYNTATPAHHIDENTQLWPINDIYREPLFRTLAPFFQPTAARGLLIVPLHYGTQVVGCLSIFRPAIDTSTVWAGWHNSDSRQLFARQSFEVWQQERTDKAQAWTTTEIRYAKALSECFSNAVQQYRLYQRVQALNVNLEQQVEERTEQLKLSNLKLRTLNSSQQILARVVSRIRESLDIEEIFRATIQELSEILKTDKVSIYQFNEDWGGEFIADFSGGLKAAGECELGVHTVWNDTYLQDSKGGRYRDGEIFVVNDVSQQGFSDCHLEVYRQYQIKSFINVPIFVGQTLWGILAVFQLREVRRWKSAEVKFIRQLTAQLGVALQHASLSASEREKNDQLSQALVKLREAQAQLIQTAKMSSLEKLVAGIAHEINNPLNFIHANVAHLKDYSSSLLEILKGYQRHCSSASAELQELLENADIDYIADDLPRLCESITTGSNRIYSIVLSLRTFSRLDEAKSKAIDLNEGIESTLLLLQHRLKDTSTCGSIKLVKQYGELPPIECRAEQINQVFMNLLANAVDELHLILSEDKEEKIIEITTQCLDQGWLMVSIKDNGRGIPEDVLERMYDPFYTTKLVGQGTGLGLAISYKIIEKHQGKLYCNSVIGEGTTFIIELPLQRPVENMDTFSSTTSLSNA